MVRRTDRPAMTIAVDLGRKATKQTNKTNKGLSFSNTEMKLKCQKYCLISKEMTFFLGCDVFIARMYSQNFLIKN